MTSISLFFLLGLIGCEPDYPNDADHADATVPECTSCHVDGTDSEAPEPSDGHFEDDGSLTESRTDCTSCHEMAD